MIGTEGVELKPEQLPHVTRVLEERAALNAKIDKLAAFIKTPTFTGLDDEDRSLLSMQLRAMRNYLDILDDRIARFK